MLKVMAMVSETSVMREEPEQIFMALFYSFTKLLNKGEMCPSCFLDCVVPEVMLV